MVSTPPEVGNDTDAAALRAEIARLQAQIEARDNLLAVAAHELRNPMHTILLLVRAALKLARDGRGQELVPRLERIRHVVDVYMKRATLLLDSVRLEASAWTGDRSEFDLCELVREINASYEPEAQYAGSKVTLDLPASLRGHWDRLAMEQIVANLLSNAIKYGDGRPVRLRLAEADSDAVLLEVSDQGAGIPVEDQERIFERFQQAIGAGQKRSGFGIGLWLVKSLVVAHAGRITVDSRPGQGTTFTVRLPRSIDASGVRPQRVSIGEVHT